MGGSLRSSAAGVREPIAIVGMGCRLPGGIHTPEDFWQLLCDGREAITEVPASRWSLERHFHPDPLHPLTQHVRHGGFLEAIDQFDAGFFGISPREAVCMDPQQRLLLEVTWRTLEDAGIPADRLRGKPVGVFIGISSADYSSLLWASAERFATPDNEPFVLPGNTGCIAANRLSYVFDFKGPSFTVDTACSSSLVAVHLACESLWRGESQAAVAGGVQALIHPGIQMSFCKAGLLAPDGRCKSFDACADGYGRSEGAGAVLLKPLSVAQADGDRIYALIHGSAVNSDGRSQGMVAPNAKAQSGCVSQALQRSGFDPAAVQYVEAHGTGTRQGDPIELRALGTVLAEGRDSGNPCRVGSVKTNLGHSETAAGITGLIKAALCVHHRKLPASLHCHTPNPAIDFAALKLQVQTQLEPFPHADQPRVVGVSSFGFGGTNAHVVLAEAPDVSARRPSPEAGPRLPLQLVSLSARTPEALQQLAADLADRLRQAPSLPLADLAATANVRRTAFPHRLVALAASGDRLQAVLERLVRGESAVAAGLIRGQVERRPGKLAWLITGQGSQTLGMAGELWAQHPLFREAFGRVAALLDPHLELPLRQFVQPPAGQQQALDALLQQTGTAQPALFAVGYALSQLWLSWGIEPDLLLGHSVGEVLAAHLAGVFSLEDACRLILARGRLMQAQPAMGAMVAVFAGEQSLQALLQRHPAVVVAALNSPANTVLSGPEVAVAALVADAEAAGLVCRSLAVSHAFHSPAMAPVLEAFARELAQIAFVPPSRPLVSSLTGELAGPELAQPEYWCQQLLNPVRFAQGMQALRGHQASWFLEIGVRPTLIGLGRQCLDDPELQFLPSLLPGQPDLEVLFTSLARLYCSGHTVDWQGFHHPFPSRPVTLPGYPFQRQRYWWSSADAEGAPASVWLDQLGIPAQPTLAPAGLMRLDQPGPQRRYEITVSAEDPTDLKDHRLRSRVVFPAAGFLEQALLLLQQEGQPLRLAALELERPLTLQIQPCRLHLELDPEERHLRLYSGRDGDWLLHGQLALPGLPGSLPWLPSSPADAAEELDLREFYAALASCGLNYGASFRQLTQLRREPGQCWAQLQRQAGGTDRGLLDSCFQVVAAALDPQAVAGQVLLPVGLEELELTALPLPHQFSCEVRLLPSEEPAFVRADLLLQDAGQVIGWIRGFRLRRLPRQALEWMFPEPEAEAISASEPVAWLHRSVWQPLEPSPASALLRDPVLLVAEQPQAQTRPLHSWLSGQGITVVECAWRDPIPWPELPRLGPVVLWPDLAAAEPNVLQLSGTLLAISQALAAAGSPRAVWLVLAGEGAAAGALAAWARTAALELPDLAWTVLQLPANSEQQPGAEDWPLIWAAGQREAALAWCHGQLQGLRLEPLAAERFRFATSAAGNLDALGPVPLGPLPLAAGELELAVEATGLNFRDVLNGLGLLGAYSAQLGLEEASLLPFGGEGVGRVVAVGAGVPQAWIGERVLAALAVGSLASHVRCRQELCVSLPEPFSPELGASVSTAFLTAIYGLQTLAQLQPGETVLIHAAAGGVGQAALQVARRCGARIFATASAAKQPALLEQGVEAVFDSRSLAFADQLLAATAGCGVDVVLNSLKGPWVDASFQALARGGRFVELGKLEIWSRQLAAQRRPDVTYLPFDLLEVAAAEPRQIRGLLLAFLADLQSGAYSPIPLQVFPRERTPEAFRLMAQARHVGKVVISHGEQPAPLRLLREATYLVTGGLGGLGLQLLPWLADQGATSLLLVSRSVAAPGSEAEALLQRLAERGIHCTCLPLALGGETAEQQLVEALAALPPDRPLRGLVHAAGVLDDGLIGGQTPERLAAVLAPKLEGWQQLERAVVRADAPLEWAVAFSSMAAVLGSPGQSSYAAANGALDGLCASGVPFAGRAVALAIQWGPWAGAGMAAGLAKRFEALGVHPLPPPGALEALGLALQRGRGGVVAVLHNDWSQLVAQAPPRQAAAMALLSTGAGAATEAAGPPALRQQLQGLPPEQRRPQVIALLQQRLAPLMGLADGSSLDPGESLFQIGLDSLMTVELVAGIQRDLGVTLELDALTGEPSLATLASLLLRSLELEHLPAVELDLAREATLPASWQLPPAALPAQAPGEAVLLTGASGFLGAYLLAGQLQRWPELRLKTLVRAPDAAAGLERLRQNLQRYQLWQPQWEERLEVVPGDLALPRFGLEPEAFRSLALGLGGILHNGAQLSQMASYSQLATANVGGTRTVLELAALERPLAVELISSVAVFEATVYRDREILETDDLAEWQGIPLGYSQTKWVSERLVQAAGRAGLPVRVYRPPLIAGHSQSGLWHHDDLLHRLLRGCLELSLAPELSWELDLVPVDYVADAVTALAWQPPQAGTCFHLHHPEPVLLADLLQGLIERGAPLTLVPMDQWLEVLEGEPRNPLFPIRAFFTRTWGEEQLTYPQLNQAGLRARPSCAATVAALAQHGVRCPRFHELMAPYARTFLGSLALG